MKATLQVSLGIFAVLIFVTGCSTPESRAREKASAFDRLPAVYQDTALNGEVRPGMNKDAVYVALGEPDRVTEGVDHGKKVEKWIYTTPEYYSYPSWYPYPYYYGGLGYVGGPGYRDPFYMTGERVSTIVNFENGRVTGWEQAS